MNYLISDRDLIVCLFHQNGGSMRVGAISPSTDLEHLMSGATPPPLDWNPLADGVYLSLSLYRLTASYKSSTFLEIF